MVNAALPAVAAAKLAARWTLLLPGWLPPASRRGRSAPRPGRRRRARRPERPRVALRARPDRGDRLQGRRRRLARDPEVRPVLRLGPDLGPEPRHLRRARLHLRHGAHVGRRAALRGAVSIGIGLYLSELAPGRGARRRRVADRDARRRPERDHRPLGDPRPRPVRPEGSRAVPRSFSAGRRSSAADDHTGGYLPAMIILTIMIVPISSSVCRELFLTVPQELKEGAYGLGLTRWEMVRGVILPVHARRRRRRDAARPRPRARRGDRGHAGDRQQHRPPHLVLRARRHARQPDRRRSTRARRTTSRPRR